MTSPVTAPSADKSREEAAHAGTDAMTDRGAGAQVDAFGGGDDGGHRFADERALRTGVAEHGGDDAGVEHAGHGDAVGGGFEAGDFADRFDQRETMMRAGAAQERAVDIEKHEGIRGGQPLL